ncbi:universal stress protein [Microbacterium betulae]|uniref:Universal stress protein n=1 Tax=Microbacterium betulae TaxID=2981139 RepID=A0AA97FI61_9MICO|nr:universal stress protein [Microbacterium sp. AB]WOF23678.1 universal stress protein [Microbacterium sp. AB]
MTASLVVGYTATPQGADAVALAGRIAEAAGAFVEVVLVVPSDGRSVLTPPDASYDAYVRDQARDWLRDAADILPSGVGRNAHVRTADSSAEGLVAAAREFAASHIVVGAANGGRRGRHRLGSVASELLHSSDVPVVLAPAGSAEDAAPLSRVTAAVGTRPGADVLIDEAAALATAAGVPLRLVSLVTVDLPAGLETAAIRAVGSSHADEVLDAARDQLPAGLAVDAVVADGESIEDAVARLDWLPGEVVLVGSSRLARPRLLFLGSTAAKMLHELPVPLVVVPRTRASGEG